ncbi:MAG: ATP-binding protein [Spirochaetes bacterium]|nr:ATP-binding protein [Spirochaetota bacterium]
MNAGCTQRITLAGVILFSLVLTGLIGIIDIITTSRFRLFSLYLIPIFIATYYYNRIFGLVMGLLSSFFIYLTNVNGIMRIDSAHLWNSGMMLIIYVLVVFLINLLKNRVAAERRKEKRYFEEKLEIINKNLKDKEILIREIHHRMKNNLAEIDSLISLSSGDSQDENLEAIRRRLHVYKLLYEKLTYSDQSNDEILLNDYLSDISGYILEKDSEDRKRIQLKLTGGDFPITMKAATLIGLIINELLTNSLRHAFPGDTKGLIRIESAIRGRVVSMMYEDSGPGFEFGAENKTGGHIGMLLIQTLTEQMHGRMHYSRMPGPHFDFEFTV